MNAFLELTLCHNSESRIPNPESGIIEIENGERENSLQRSPINKYTTRVSKR